jgi:integrase/recombinase XerD
VIELFAQHQLFRGFSLRTVQRRTTTLRQFQRFLEPATLGDATARHVEQFLSAKPAARTRHAYRSDLRVFYHWAVDRGLVTADPAAKVESIKVPKGLPRPIDTAAAAATLRWGSLRTRRMVGLALFAGLRCCEIAALHAEDVWVHADSPVVVVRNGKGGRDRVVPIHPELGLLLADLSPAGPLFPGRAGETVRPASVSSTISRHLHLSGLNATPHQLRHTFGTELARVSGGDMVFTAELMGHASMNTTMGYVRLATGGGADIVGQMYSEVA